MKRILCFVLFIASFATPSIAQTVKDIYYVRMFDEEESQPVYKAILYRLQKNIAIKNRLIAIDNSELTTVHRTHQITVYESNSGDYAAITIVLFYVDDYGCSQRTLYYTQGYSIRDTSLMLNNATNFVLNYFRK